MAQFRVDHPHPPVDVKVAPSWSSWKEVPRNAHEVAQHGPFFVEIFSGTVRLTQCVRELGVPCLPPIDIMPSLSVLEPKDVVDLDFWDFFMELVWFGAVAFIHFGTPCNTFSSARKDDGGPPPLRSVEFPDGLPSVPLAYQPSLFLGNLFLDRTIEAALAVVVLGGDFSIENPLGSLLWDTARSKALLLHARAHFVDLDQCMFGAPTQKPTRLMVTHHAFSSLAVKCCGGHRHQKLKGKVWSDFFSKLWCSERSLLRSIRGGCAKLWPCLFKRLCPVLWQFSLLLFSCCIHHRSLGRELLVKLWFTSYIGNKTLRAWPKAQAISSKEEP